MAHGPNKSFAAARKRVGWSADHVARREAARDERNANDPRIEVMRRVSAGEMSVEEGVAAIRAMD